MTFQVIFNSAQSIEIDRRRVVGQSISRSQRIKSAERVTAQPFVLTVTPIARFKYESLRWVIEAIQNYDRNTECTVNIAQASGLNYLTRYTGGLTEAQATAITVNTWTNRTVVFNNLPSVASSTVMFKAGDWIQPTNSRYPYIISNDVLRGSASTASGTVHRPLITSEGINPVGDIRVGTETTMVVLASEFPTYQIIFKDWAQYTGDFVFVEKVI